MDGHHRDPDDALDREPEGRGGQESRRAAEPGKPSDVGALDGAAAAGSPGAIGNRDEDEDGGVPTSPPDPSIGPD